MIIIDNRLCIMVIELLTYSLFTLLCQILLTIKLVTYMV